MTKKTSYIATLLMLTMFLPTSVYAHGGVDMVIGFSIILTATVFLGALLKKSLIIRIVGTSAHTKIGRFILLALVEVILILMVLASTSSILPYPVRPIIFFPIILFPLATFICSIPNYFFLLKTTDSSLWGRVCFSFLAGMVTPLLFVTIAVVVDWLM